MLSKNDKQGDREGEMKMHFGTPSKIWSEYIWRCSHNHHGLLQKKKKKNLSNVERIIHKLEMNVDACYHILNSQMVNSFKLVWTSF